MQDTAPRSGQQPAPVLRLPRRTTTPIADAERLAAYTHQTFGTDRVDTLVELHAWNDREGLGLSAALLEAITWHVVPETPPPARAA